MHTHELMSMKVKDFMTTELISVQENTTVNLAQQIFTEHNIHHLPVINSEGALTGIISQGEILILQDWGTTFKLRTSQNKSSSILSRLLISDIMQRDVVTIEPNDTLESCALIFRENTIHALPVVKENKLLGIITTYDLLNAAYRLPNRFTQVF